MGCVGGKSGTGGRRYVGMTAPPVAEGGKLSRETAFIDTGALSLSKQFTTSYAAFPRNDRGEAHQRARHNLGYSKDDRLPAGEGNNIQVRATALREEKRGRQV